MGLVNGLRSALGWKVARPGKTQGFCRVSQARCGYWVLYTPSSNRTRQGKNYRWFRSGLSIGEKPKEQLRRIYWEHLRTHFCQNLLVPRTCYIGDMSLRKDVILQWDCVRYDDAIVLTCSGLTGKELLCLKARGCDLAWDTHKRIVPGICVPSWWFTRSFLDG